MILEKQTENLVISDGDSVDTIKSKLDLESADFLMRMMTKGFYSDAIGSTVRETVSNAIDSVRKAGTNEPVIIGFNRNSQGNYEYSVQDYGLGLDHETVVNVISLYGKSTKREDSSAIGCMGLGWKSPLSYTPSFQFIAVKDGIKRKYIQSEDEDGGSTIDLLDESSTDEKNGVKVIVNVNYHDRSEFIEKINEQLAYFQGVYFQSEFLKNDFNIYRGEDFQWSSLCNDNYLHICLDDVYYPIDFAKLGIPTIQFPLALRFSLTDGIYPLPNRESIRYTKEAKEIILKKIEKVADYFVNKYNEELNSEEKNIFKIADYYRDSTRYVKSFVEGKSSLNITPLLKYSHIKIEEPKLDEIKLLDLSKILNSNREFLIGEYDIKYNYSYEKFTGKKRWDRFNWNSIDRTNVYICSDAPGKVKMEYLRDLWGNSNILVINKIQSYTLGNIKNLYSGGYNKYYRLLELNKYPKTEWRQRIKEYQYLQSLIFSRFENLDNIQVPQEWLDERKKLREADKILQETKKKLRKGNGEVVGKLALPLERYVSGKHCKFESTNFNLDKAYKEKYFTIYTTHDNDDKIQKYYTIFKHNKVRFVTFSGREIKLLKDVKIHNWMNMDEFEEGKHILYKRIVTSYLISQLISKNFASFSKIGIIRNISTDLADKLQKLKEYKEDNYLGGNDEIYAAMLEVAQSKNLFDTSIYDIYKEVKNVLEKLKFLNPILEHAPRYYDNIEGYNNAICDLFKYYKYRVNWGNYNLPINEEVKEEITINELENELI